MPKGVKAATHLTVRGLLSYWIKGRYYSTLPYLMGILLKTKVLSVCYSTSLLLLKLGQGTFNIYS